ncbi:hypothetical protein ACVIIW_003670 [Bradyrhizobium sp. USDA 4449]
MTRHKSGDYEVGYGKPPRERRFKPGQSGNPRGRPKKYPTLTELFADELKRKRTIVEDGQRLRVRTDEILVKRLVDVAAKGGMKALTMMMAVIEQIREIESATHADPYGMSADELAAYYDRLRKLPAHGTGIKKIKGFFP